jgi:hypothetical protein
VHPPKAPCDALGSQAMVCLAGWRVECSHLHGGREGDAANHRLRRRDVVHGGVGEQAAQRDRGVVAAQRVAQAALQRSGGRGYDGGVRAGGEGRRQCSGQRGRGAVA